MPGRERGRTARDVRARYKRVMQGIEHILVASDLDDAGQRAVESATEWARDHGAKLTVVHVVSDPVARAMASATLSRRVPSAEIRVLDGDAAAGILRVAAETSADLVVLGGRDVRGLRSVLGAVAEQVVTGARVPVLIARAARPGPVIAATDLSDPSLAALRAARELARPRGLPLVVVHCIETPSGLDAMSLLGTAHDPDPVATSGARLRALCAEGESARVVVGAPAESIVALAAEISASVVVLASHGRGGIARFVLGSVASRVARAADTSVLIVRLHPTP